MPRRDHVVVVGLGEVGLRLCLVLRACKIPLVAVESDQHAESVGLAKELGLPVVVGRGADPSLMRRLSLAKARAVVHRMAAALLTAKILGDDAESVVCLGDDAHLRFPDGRLERAELDVLAG